MAQSCPQCGSICRDDLKECAFCDSPLTGDPSGDPFVNDVYLASPTLASAFRADSTGEPEWRQEMARKLDAYRRRRRGGSALMDDGSQPALPFVEHARALAHALEHPSAPTTHASRIVVGSAPRQRTYTHAPVRREQRGGEQSDRVEISVSQPSLDFTLTDQRLHPDTHLAPVASTAERIQAGLIDSFFLALVYAGFLLFFRSLGGHVDLTKTDTGIFAASFLLLYASYFSLFMIFGAATPGMLLTGLTVVQIDGAAPETGALVWRSAGYVLSGTMLLGFLWAIWDEDHLTWHDRISQTYITHAATAADAELAASHGGHRGYVEK